MPLTRRTLFKTGLGAGLGILSTGAFAQSPKEGWDEETDVIVVGSGFAGMSAALAGALQGAKVVVLEKMPVIGGNSANSGGMFAVPASSVQKAQGIEDSPEKLMADMERIGKGLGDPAHIRFVCEKAAPAYEWTVKEMGVKWNPHLTGKGGHSASRCMITEEGTGQGILIPAMARLKELGVPVRTKVFMEKILRGPDGTAEGLLIREGWKFGDKASGTRKKIRARKGIVLAYGGFGADIPYRSKLDPQLGDKFLSTNQPGATSEAWRAASAAGANIIQADWIQCLPSCSPKEKGMGIASHFATIAGSLYGLWADSGTGRRFVDEFGDRKVCTDAILKVINGGHEALAIADANGVKKMEVVRPKLLEKMLKNGSVRQFASLEELSKAYGIPAGALEKTIADYNALLASGKDAAFGRPFDKKAKPLGTAPWYVSEMSPKVHHCMGGLLTSPKTEVLDVLTDEPIPGLFAAGECVGGIHGAVRIGACAVMDCLVNGKAAGEMAAVRQIF